MRTCVLCERTYVHVCVCVYVSGSVCAHVCGCVYGHLHVVCMCVHICVCRHVSVCVLVCVQICVCTCPCVQMRVCLRLCSSEHAGVRAWLHVGVSVRVRAYVHLPDLGHEGCKWLVAATASAFCSAESTWPGGPGGAELMWASARGQRGRAAPSHSNVYSLPMRRERKILSEFHP